MYDPELGRFLQRDPEPGILQQPSTHINKYIYANNNPISFFDPTGRNFWESVGRVAAVIVGAIAAVYAGAAIAAFAGLAAGSTGSIILGGIVGALVGGVVTGTGYALTGGDFREGFLLGAAIGLFAGAFGGAYHDSLVGIKPFKATGSKVYDGFVKGMKSLGKKAFEGGGDAVTEGFRRWSLANWPVWGEIGKLAEIAFPYVAGAAGVYGLSYIDACSKENTCSGLIPKEYDDDWSWSF